MIPLSKIYKLDRFGVKLCGMEELLIFFCNTLSSKKFSPHTILGSFPSGSAVKNPPANAGDAGDAGSIPTIAFFFSQNLLSLLFNFCGFDLSLLTNSFIVDIQLLSRVQLFVTP